MNFVSKNPFSGEVYSQFPFSTQKEISEAIDTADNAFKTWKNLSYSERGRYFINLAKKIDEQIDDLATTITIEMGKPLYEAKAELKKTIACCEYYANSAEKLLQTKQIDGGGLKAEIYFQPLGVIFGVFPWNFPFWQVLRFVVPTLMAGNTAIFKHSPNVPQCALHIVRLFNEAGFPQGVLNNTFAKINDIESIVANPKIKAVTLTGSEGAGASVAALAGKHLKKSVMELGGSDAFVVLEDADIDAAVKGALRSRYQNSGQSCIAAKRFIIRAEIATTFTEKLLAGVQQLKQGNPLENGITMGTLARPDLADKVEEQLKQTLKQGATLLHGGKRVGDAVFEPTIITNVPLNSPAFTQELFGPIAPLFIAKTDDEALALANATIYGLGSSVWSKNSTRAQYFAQNINSGMVYVNEMVRSTPELPFGGINNSGYGRELSVYGITEFVNIKGIYTRI